jgi:hypothetical protein
VRANTTLGLNSVDRNLGDLFHLYGASRWQVLTRLKLPSALPYMLAYDGKIIVIRDVRETRHLGAETKQISIFMSPFNVHVNRVPCSGRVKEVLHNKGAAADLMKPRYRMKISRWYTKQNMAIFLSGRLLPSPRAVCRKKGDVLDRGERYGVIKFISGGHLSAEDVEVKVKIDDAVKVRRCQELKSSSTSRDNQLYTPRSSAPVPMV